MQIIIFFIFFVSNPSMAQNLILKNNKTTKNIKSDDFSFESIKIMYKLTKGEQIFSSVELGLSAFGRYLSLISPTGKKIILDCVPTHSFTKWKCLSGCEGGEIKVGFHKNIKFDFIKLETFKIRDRNCDGAESDSDKFIVSNTELFYKIDGIGIEK